VSGQDEGQYLEVLEEIAATGQNLAERRLAQFHGVWQGDITRAFDACRF